MNILKKKIFILLSIFLMIGVLSTSLNVRGHEPSNMSLSYNSNTEELTVSITHTVSNPNDHYIYRVRIWINASLINTSLYTSQPSTSSFSYVYDIIANIGASIQVTADCNQGGSITRSITISETNGQTDGEPAIPGFLGLLVIVSITIFITTFTIIKKRKFIQKENN
jgi:hypothetical protein